MHQGWLYDKSKKTEYYLLCWLWAEEKEFTVDQLTKVDVALINRDKIIDFLLSHRLNETRVEALDEKIRSSQKTGLWYNDKKRPFYFYYTDRLSEKPINVIIKKKALLELSDMHKVVTR